MGICYVGPKVRVYHAYLQNFTLALLKEVQQTHISVAEAIKVKNLWSLEALPIALILGYFIRIALMALPVTSNNLHQWLSGLCLGFPVYITIFHETYFVLPIEYVARLHGRYKELSALLTTKSVSLSCPDLICTLLYRNRLSRYYSL